MPAVVAAPCFLTIGMRRVRDEYDRIVTSPLGADRLGRWGETGIAWTAQDRRVARAIARRVWSHIAVRPSFDAFNRSN